MSNKFYKVFLKNLNDKIIFFFQYFNFKELSYNL